MQTTNINNYSSTSIIVLLISCVLVSCESTQECNKIIEKQPYLSYVTQSEDTNRYLQYSCLELPECVDECSTEMDCQPYNNIDCISTNSSYGNVCLTLDIIPPPADYKCGCLEGRCRWYKEVEVCK